MIVFVIVIQVILALSCETLLVSISNTSTYHIICPSHVRSTNHDTFTLHAPISYQVVQNWRPVFHDCPAFDTYHNYEANMYPGWQWTPNPVEHVVELEEDCCSIATWNRGTRERRRRKKWSRTGMLLDEHSQNQIAETARSKCTPSLYKKVILN